MLKEFDLIFIGHFAIDTIILKGIISHSLGGGVTFGSLGTWNYNKSQKIGIFSEVAENFNREFFNIFYSTNIDLRGVKFTSENTTNFKLLYRDMGRTLTLINRAKSMEFKDIPEEFKSAKCFMVVPIANEISIEFIESLLIETDAMIAIDAQGFIRRFNQDGTLNTKPDKQIIKNIWEIMKKCGNRLIFKASEQEANLITGLNDVIASTVEIANKNNTIVLSTLDKNGSLIKKKNQKMLYIPAFKPQQEVDETGAGDCYLAIFASEYIQNSSSWNDIERNGYCASAAASFLLEKKGPLGFKSTEEVQKRLKNNNFIESQLREKIKKNNF
ncbi:MAG: PfkB family carbohydrate kinase [Promethearchaeota archaeon]